MSRIDNHKAVASNPHLHNSSSSNSNSINLKRHLDLSQFKVLRRMVRDPNHQSSGTRGHEQQSTLTKALKRGASAQKE